jgi:hypothetical protein
MKESPLFVKTFDCLKWVLARTESFPKSQRFLLAKRINDAMFDFYERIGEAAVIKGTAELDRLREADVRLKHLTQYLRLAMELKYLSFQQYNHVSMLVHELGRLLGAWMKKIEKQLTKFPPNQNVSNQGQG